MKRVPPSVHRHPQPFLVLGSVLILSAMFGLYRPQPALAEILAEEPTEEQPPVLEAPRPATSGNWQALIRVDGRPPCLSASALRDHVQTWLERPTLPDGLSVVITSRGRALSFTIEEQGTRRASRRFDDMAGSCADRQAALGLAIALALDATIFQEVEVLRQVAPDLADRGPAPTVSEPSFALEIGAFGGYGLLPGWTGGAQLTVELSWPLWSMRLGARSTVPTDVGVGSHFAQSLALVADAGVCLHHDDRLYRLSGCGQVSAGQVLAEGRGFTEIRSASLTLLTAGARFGFDVSLGSEALWLQTSLESNAFLIGPVYQVDDGAGTVVAERESPPANVMLSIGLRAVFF